MRSLTTTLLAAQKQATAIPYVKVTATNKIAGVVRYDWSQLYSGSEEEGYHALTMPGDGSLIRVRITPPADSRKLYRQRVSDPDTESDFSQWVYTGQYNALAVAAASLGAEVSIFWIKSNREIRCIKSTDYGVNWGSPELIDYTLTTSVGGLAVAYKPGGDLAIFFTDQSSLYVKRKISGEWQTKSSWDKATGDLSGVACVYDSDWNLMVTGKDASGNFKLWSLIYGDGGDVPAGNWSDLRELTSAPAGGDFEFQQPFLDKPDVYRCFFVEKFTGTEACNRPFWSHSIIDAEYIDGLWREPVPFNLSSEYGLAIAHHGDYVWLTGPAVVYRAGLTASSLDLTADVVGVRQELGESTGKLAVELRNDDGRYATPGQGSLTVLDIGCQIEFSPGYVTNNGNEYSPGQTFELEAYEHISSGGKASLVLHAVSGWEVVAGWKARHQLRWNKASEEMSVKEIMALILARTGLKLEVKSQSSVITGFYPDFTVSAGNDGGMVIKKLLSFVPDAIFIEGNKAYIVNPLASDSSVYSYGGEHPIREGRYRREASGMNRVQVEGYDADSSELILVNSFDWDEMGRLYDRLKQVDDRNIGTVDEASERGEAYLREAEIAAAGGNILVPVNCGQQLYDVIDVTDASAGLYSEKKRVLGMVLVYNPQRGEYSQRIWLGAV